MGHPFTQLENGHIHGPTDAKSNDTSKSNSQPQQLDAQDENYLNIGIKDNHLIWIAERFDEFSQFKNM